eukprot:gnl/TRDRNA2_/TRDRNA2_81571_c0_seq1.p1 gnl/TRDRNA2_/TRDRNA2_81571_c0~~gnl/TRDRNA2_/TRDRNA2_81571_c0_seq1.p1  ORF type:complete len:120 (-),score=0.43 gnl/TRDRNA2_/TRDRNA2_81571_c0_seq1:147-506(-)
MCFSAAIEGDEKRTKEINRILAASFLLIVWLPLSGLVVAVASIPWGTSILESGPAFCHQCSHLSCMRELVRKKARPDPKLLLTPGTDYNNLLSDSRLPGPPSNQTHSVDSCAHGAADAV